MISWILFFILSVPVKCTYGENCRPLIICNWHYLQNWWRIKGGYMRCLSQCDNYSLHRREQGFEPSTSRSQDLFYNMSHCSPNSEE